MTAEYHFKDFFEQGNETEILTELLEVKRQKPTEILYQTMN